MALSKSSFPGDRTRFAKLGSIIVEVLTPILRDLLEYEISPTDLYTKATSHGHIFNHLCRDQIIKIENAYLYGYREFDITLLYTVLCNLSSKIAPPEEWGAYQLPNWNEISAVKDIERIRIMKNTLYSHASTACISETDFVNYLAVIECVCDRMGGYLSVDQKYLRSLETVKIRPLDEELTNEWVEKIKQAREREKNIYDILTGMKASLERLEKGSLPSATAKVNVESKDPAKGIQVNYLLETTSDLLNLMVDNINQETTEDELQELYYTVEEFFKDETNQNLLASSEPFFKKLLSKIKTNAIQQGGVNIVILAKFARLALRLKKNYCANIKKSSCGSLLLELTFCTEEGYKLYKRDLVRGDIGKEILELLLYQSYLACFDLKNTDLIISLNDQTIYYGPGEGKHVDGSVSGTSERKFGSTIQEKYIGYKDADDLPGGSKKSLRFSMDTYEFSQRNIRKTESDRMFLEEEKSSGHKEDADDLPSGSKKSPPFLRDTLTPPPKKMRKTEKGPGLVEEARTSLLLEVSNNEKMEQLKDNGEFEFRIQRLIRFLDIETYHQPYYGNHMETTEYENIIKRVDYLDCSGLHFSKAEKQCQSFDPFFQSSVDHFLEWIAECGKVFRKAQSPKCQLILSIIFSACAKKALLEFEPRDLSFLIHRCLEFAIESKNHILLSEIVRSYIFHFDFHLCKLFKNKIISYVDMDTFLTTAKYMILRKCPRLRQNAIRLSFSCECNKENRLVIMMIYKGIIEMKDGIPEKAMGVDLVLFNYTQPSDEACTVFNSISTSRLSCMLPVITENDARTLFNKHSNLTLISASPFKSSGYSKGKHNIVEKLCIILLCLHKGYVPFGEMEFPKQINGFEVDVQEGYCSLGSGRSIDFGGHIRRVRKINSPGCGSIGGFVDLPNGGVGLITCAHVVLSTDELKIPWENLKDKLKKSSDVFEVEMFDKNQHRFHGCGNIVNKYFLERHSFICNSVDAALIQLDPTLNEFGFPVIPANQLYTAGFDPNKTPVFTGEIVTVQDPDPHLNISSKIPGRLDSVIKYGSKTGFTIGSLYFNRAHIRFEDDTGGLPDKTSAVMCNQIEIQSLPHGTFFEPGDSGAFVFCINPDKTLSCLGMAIGSTTKGSCFVTPMARILDSFDLPHRLKPCSPFVSGVSKGSLSAHQSHIPTAANLEALLLNFQTNIQMSMANIQTALETKFENLRTDVRESNEKIQTEVDNLKTKVGDLEPPRQV